LCCYRDRRDPVNYVYETTTGDREQHEYDVLQTDQHHPPRHDGRHTYENAAAAE